VLTVAAVQVGNYCDRGAEYVRKLFDGVGRHLSCEWRGLCVTDDSLSVPEGISVIAPPEGVDGWFNKLSLFRPGMFKPGSRVLYFDLDTVIVGSLDGLAGYVGRLACMDDINGEGPATGVMAWEAGRYDHIWERWEAAGRPEMPQGDQQWMHFVERNCARLNRIFPDQLVSFKADVFPIGRVPDGARAVYFHGFPRPHNLDADWMTKHWI
jgi:hypothetical protein